MRATAAAVQSRRASRSGITSHALIWIQAKNRNTQATESLGLWTGPDHQQFMGRTYYGAGNVLEMGAIQTEIGLSVRRLRIGLSAVSGEVEMMLRGYEPKGAPVEVHRAEFDDGGVLLATPERIFKGWINTAPIVTPAIGGMATAAIECVSNSRMLTLFGKNVKSDAQQRQRDGDRFRRNATSAGEAKIYWGEHRARAASVSVSRPPSAVSDQRSSGR